MFCTCWCFPSYSTSSIAAVAFLLRTVLHCLWDLPHPRLSGGYSVLLHDAEESLYDAIWCYMRLYRATWTCITRTEAGETLHSKSKDGLDRVQGEVYDFQDTNTGNLAHPPCCLALSHHTERTRERKPSFTHIMQYTRQAVARTRNWYH